MRRIIIVAFVAMFILSGCGKADGVGTTEDFKIPNVKDDFCGINISFQYCKCAFHGEYCKDIGMSKKEAARYVDEEFNKWLKPQRETFANNCKDGNGYMDGDTCNYCDNGFMVKNDSCIPGEPELAMNEGVIKLPEGPYNEDCSLKQDEFDKDWKKYSDIDNAIAPETRSYEAKQALTAYETMISKLVESFEAQRDIEVEDEMQANLNEYRTALVQNQKANLLKAFWRLSWVTYSTIKSGTSAGKSFSNLLTSTGSAAQSIASGLKTFQATVPSSSDLAIDKSTLLGKAESVGAKVALEAVESLGDPSKIAQRFMKSSFDVVMPSANITEAEINILRQQQIDKGAVDQVLAASRAANTERQARLTTLEQEIKSLEAQVSEWEGKEKDRVSASLVDSCKKLTNQEPVPPGE